MIIFVFCVVGFVTCGWVGAAGWPAFNHDNQRSGVSRERLEMPLDESWVFRAAHRPEPAWPKPARQDFWHDHFNLRPTVTYDKVFHVVGAGDTVYFGSSADDKVYALDAASGRQRWAFFTEAPVRLAPTVVGNRVYVGSDDGCIYCLSADNGSLVWRYEVAGQSRMIPGNGRMISMWPVRSGVVVDSGVVYFAAGLFPNQGTYLFALGAEDGSMKWKQEVGVSPQGYILASEERLYVPTGRASPAMFSRVDGRFLGELPSAGGAYALLTEDVLVTGPGRGPKELNAGDVKTKDRIAMFGGLRMLVDGSIAYMQSEDKLSALDRGRYFALSREKNDLSGQCSQIEKQLKSLSESAPQAQPLQESLQAIKVRLGELSNELEGCYLWTVPCQYPYSIIMAGDILFVGGDDRVAALSAKDGQEVWNAPVQGAAHGLSIVNGGLYVSTDEGRIHCFRNNIQEKGNVIGAQMNTRPWPQDELASLYANAAKRIVETTGIAKGYCVVLDSGKGQLAYELARLTDLKIICVEKDIAKVNAARAALDEAGLYGRVVVHQASGAELPYTSCFANLVVSDEALRIGQLPNSANEVCRVLRPCGGVIAVCLPVGKYKPESLERWGHRSITGWKTNKADRIVLAWARRGPLEGAGEWTHTYAEPGNSACSRDKLIQGKMALQWFGRPGPERMIDRHHRNVPPLFKDGRLFVPGDCIVFAVDAYNGTILWDVEIPNSRRLGVFLDCGSMVVDEQLLYVVAEDKCHGFDVQTGRRRLTHTMPQLVEGQPRHWGYIAYSGDILFGSGRRQGASYTETSYEADQALWHRDMKLVVSDYVFAMEKNGGEVVWTYGDGLVLNTTIAVGGGRMYFVETYSAKALADTVGRMPVKTLFDGGDQYLVALEAETGRIIYKKDIYIANFEEPVFLNYVKETVLLSGSKLVGDSIRYYYYAFDARSGEPRWDLSHDSELATDGGHGEYNRHPTIIGDTVYAWPYAYDLKTGESVKGWRFDRRGHGCGGVSASTQCLFWRGGNPWMYDLRPGGGPSRLTTVTRPGCWINIIPAGGLVLIPESSSGCTCGFAVQSSMAFIPNELLKRNWSAAK